MKLKMHLTGGQSLTAQLIDDPFVHNWAEGAVKLPLDQTEHTSMGSDNDHYPVEQWHGNIRELCKQLPALLEPVGLSVPAFFPTVDTLLTLNSTDAYQQHMNRIHRWLVFCMFRTPYVIDGVDYIPNNLDELFEKDYNGMLHALFTLNQLVHTTEGGYTRPGKASFPSVTYGNTMWDQGFTEDDRIGWAKDLEYKHLLTNQNHDLWLAKRILGKDFRECWLDADDPSYADITNVGDILHYCFEVDPLNDDSDFYYSDEFADWMIAHGRNTDIQTTGRIPLGDLIDAPADLKRIMDTCSIERLEIL